MTRPGKVTVSEASDILENYLRRTGLRQPSDAAHQYAITLLRQWTEHLDEVMEASGISVWQRRTIIREFIYGAVPLQAEAELRVSMHKDMAYRAQRAAPDAGIPPS
jgi:hypothetical protein